MYLSITGTVNYLKSGDFQPKKDRNYLFIVVALFFAVLIMFTGGFAEQSPSIPSILHMPLLLVYILLPFITVLLTGKYLKSNKESFWRKIIILSVPCLFKSLVIASILLLLYVTVRVLLIEGDMLKFPPQAGFYATSLTILLTWYIFTSNLLKALSRFSSNTDS
jgi:hypothetical protein